MNSQNFLLVGLIIVLFVSGCATRPKPEELPHTESIGSGKIEKRFDVNGDGLHQNRTDRNSSPAFAIISSIVEAAGTRNGYEISGIRRGQLITVFVEESFSLGECIEVLTSKENIDEHTFLLRKATLKKSTRCK